MPSWQSRIAALFIRMTIKRAGKKQAYDELETVQLLRRWMTPSGLMRSKLPGGIIHDPVRVENRSIVGEWLIPERPPLPPESWIYYLHGGGYIAGSPATHRYFTTSLAIASNSRLFSLDYRLAPEHIFPAAVDDAVAGYRWLLDQGVDPRRAVIGGDSAGGGLTLATLLRVRDAGLPLPAGAFLLSPWTDLACTGETLDINDAADDMLCGKEVHRMSRVYFGDASPRDPHVSPLYANFTSFPPLRIYASNSEVLLDDSKRLAERARFYGVEVDLRIRENLLHAWPVLMRFNLPESRQAMLEIADFVRERTSAARSDSQAAD